MIINKDNEEASIDLKENSENNLNSQMDSQTQNDIFSWWGVFAFFALFTIVFSATLFVFKNSQEDGVFANNKKNEQNTQNAAVFEIPKVTNTQTSNENIVPVKVVLYKDPFVDIDLEAQAVCVIDTVTGKVLYERNKNTRLPLASLTKVMTAYVATETMGGNEIVAISAEDIKKEGNSGLLLGERWKISDLLDFTLITSSNDGASAIATAAGVFLQHQATTTAWQDPSASSGQDPSVNGGQDSSAGSEQDPKKIFIEKMNEQAQALELTHMEFNNESGLDISNAQSGAYGTAYEVAMLFEYILKNKQDLLKATVHETLEINSENNIVHTAKNTNEFVGSFPGLLASKTGYTDMAGGNLGVVFDSGIGSPIIIVVLGSTIDGRFEDVMKLYEASLKEVSQGMY